MGELATAILSRDEARALTDEIKEDAERLWAKLLEAYEGMAHAALGYSSWGAYFETEFGRSDASAYRILQSARVMRQLPMGSPRPANERQARELVPLLKEPEALRETWAEVVELHSEPSAAEVREAVAKRGQMNKLKIKAVAHRPSTSRLPALAGKAAAIADALDTFDWSELIPLIPNDDRKAYVKDFRRGAHSLYKLAKEMEECADR